MMAPEFEKKQTPDGAYHCKKIQLFSRRANVFREEYKVHKVYILQKIVINLWGRWGARSIYGMAERLPWHPLLVKLSLLVS